MPENISESAARYLQRLSIDRLNEMQLEFISRAAKNSHIVLLSPTGSGKTVAFLVPLFHSLKEDVREVQVLIIVPSRELDIPEIKHVVHYQLPPKEDALIHRNGRAARMHAEEAI